MARYIPIIKNLLGKQKGKDRVRLLTVTTENTGEIPSTAEIRAHNKAIGKLIKRYFKGGVSVNEVKGTYLHSHCIVYGPFIHQETISKTWEALTGAKVVDIRWVRQKATDVAGHVSKYLKKPYRYENTEKGVSLAIRFLINFKGIRRVHSFGIFYAAGQNGKRLAWTCPYCGSQMVKLQWLKYRDDWSVSDCKRSGVLAFKDILKIQQENHLVNWQHEEARAFARA